MTVSEVIAAVKAGQSLEKADLSGLDLSGQDLRKAKLSFANLKECNLQGADLRDAADRTGAKIRKWALKKAFIAGPTAYRS